MKATSRRRFLAAIAGAIGVSSAGCTVQFEGTPPTGGGGGGPQAGRQGANGPVNAGERFYQSGPPERSGDQITYPSDGHGSIQAAYGELPENGTLVIESGTYPERLSLDQNPSDNVTVVGEGDVTLTQPDSAERYTVGMPAVSPEYTTQTTLAEPHTNNESTLLLESVPAEWSSGDVIRIREDQPPYHPPDHGYVGGEPTHEMGTIANINRSNNTVKLANPLWLPYPNDYETEVGLVTDWVATDIHLANLTIHGDPSVVGGANLMPLHLYGLRNLWADGLTIEHSANDGMLCRLGHSYRCRFDNITFNDGARYGLDVVRGSCDTYATNLEATNINRYVARWGDPTSEEAGAPVGGLAQNITASDYGNFACNSHLPSWHVTYENVNANNCPLTRLRSYGQTVENFTAVSEGVGDSDFQISIEQTPDNCTVRGGAADGVADIDVDGGYIFYFNTSNPSARPWDEYARNIRFRNLSIAKIPGKSADDIGLFTEDGANIRVKIEFYGVYYDGEHITAENVRNWDHYEASTTDDYTIVIEEP